MELVFAKGSNILLFEHLVHSFDGVAINSITHDVQSTGFETVHVLQLLGISVLVTQRFNRLIQKLFAVNFLRNSFSIKVRCIDGILSNAYFVILRIPNHLDLSLGINAESVTEGI